MSQHTQTFTCHLSEAAISVSPQKAAATQFGIRNSMQKDANALCLVKAVNFTKVKVKQPCQQENNDIINITHCMALDYPYILSNLLSV